MSQAELDVTNYLAQRKAKKSGGQRFKTFTASAAFLATEDGGDDFESGATPLPTTSSSVQHGSGAASFAAAAGGSSSRHISGPAASTLVAGEWIDDEAQFSAQPRLVVGGVQVHDLQALDLNRESSLAKQQTQQTPYQMTSSRAAEGTTETIRPSAAPAGQRRGDFPSLASTTSGGSSAPAAPVTSVWGRVERPAPAPLREEPKVMEERPEPSRSPEGEAKPGVWRPKSISGSSAMPSGSSSRSTGPAAGGFAAAARTGGPSPSAPAGGMDTEGLKRSSNPWRPRRPGNE